MAFVPGGPIGQRPKNSLFGSLGGLGGMAMGAIPAAGDALTTDAAAAEEEPWFDFTNPLAMAGLQMISNGLSPSLGKPRAFLENVPQMMMAGEKMQAAQREEDRLIADREEAAATKAQLAAALKEQLPANLHSLADADPESALAIWKQLNPQADPQGLINVGGGQIYDPNSGSWITAPNPIGPDTVINNNLSQDKFGDAFGSEIGKQQAGLIDAGRIATSNNVRLGQLEQHLANAPQGVQGAMTQFAGSLGIPVEGVDDIQAAQALINQMVPGQRPPGSGTMSDADLALFKQSLPAIINQPGGNAYIIQTTKAINDYTIEQGRIAEMLATNQIDLPTAMQMQRAVPNPLAEFSAQVGGQTGAKPAPGNASANDPLGIR